MARGEHREYVHADGVISRCPTCASTKRTNYFARQEQQIAGIRDGIPYTHVVWRRTSCEDCGQFRIDRTHENRPGDVVPEPQIYNGPEEKAVAVPAPVPRNAKPKQPRKQPQKPKA